MKPLPPVPLTKEDHDIWCRVTWDGHLKGWHEFAEDCDRRDAKLMHWAASWRGMSWRTLEWGEVSPSWAGWLVYQGELYFGGSHYTC
jgi:hypothetical protein